jgi:hypothetical protein
VRYCWSKIVRAGRTTYAAETPIGRVTAKMHRTHGGAMQPRAILPDGRYVSGNTVEDAMAKVEQFIARETAEQAPNK